MIVSKINKIISYLVILSLVLGQFGRIPFGGYIVGVYIWDVFIGIYVLSFILFVLPVLLKKKKFVNIPSFYKYLMLFIIWALISIINGYRFIDSFSEFAVSISYLVRFISYFIFGLGFYFDMLNDLKYRKNILKVIVLFGFLLSLFGFIQLLVFPDLGKLDTSLLWDPHKGRLVSTIFDPNFVAVILLVPILSNVLLIFEKISKKKYSILNIIMWSIPVVSMLLAELLTYSRSGWLALSVVLFIVSVVRYRFLLLITILMAFGSYYFIPRIQTRVSGVTDPSDSFYFRYKSWEDAILIIKENPVIGYGYNTYRYVQADHGFFDYTNEIGNRSGAGSDSSVLLIWATTGIVGLFFYITAFFSVFIKSIKVYIKERKGKQFLLNLFLMSLIPATFLESQFVNSLLYPHVVLLTFLFIGMFLSKEAN